MNPLNKGDQGPIVANLQKLLTNRNYPTEVTSFFSNDTYVALRAFQTQNRDQHGHPLVIDGIVGPLTWWSLTHPKPDITPYSAVDYTQMPATGGSIVGRAALEAAIGELQAGAGEIGGDNAEPWVKKYLAPAGLGEGNPWCAAFVSWCFLEACGGDRAAMPFRYDPSTRSLLRQLQAKGWAQGPGTGYQPVPGDLVVWWREELTGWLGHIGIVHQLRDGMLYTLEGNRSPKVQGFSYVLSRMDQLLGFGHLPV